jgi:small subunit ribosomal protein S20
MPITKSATKALRVSKRKRVFNLARRDEMKKAINELKKAALAKNKKVAETLLPRAYQVLDKAVKRGIIKKNTASRKKSRLTNLVKQIS